MDDVIIKCCASPIDQLKIKYDRDMGRVLLCTEHEDKGGVSIIIRTDEQRDTIAAAVLAMYDVDLREHV